MSKTTDRVHRFDVLAINRQDGTILWQQTIREELPHEGTHNEGSWASSSPITDGEHVYAHFGSRGLYCFDMQGNLIWERDLGKMQIKMSFGEGSSPALHGDTIVVNWDHEGQSYIVALNKRTGQEIWKVDRDEVTSWATPLVIVHKGEAQAIVSATKLVRSYDLATGGLIWQVGGMTANVIPNPVSSNGTVYVMSGFRGNALLALNLNLASGDITDSEAIIWRYVGASERVYVTGQNGATVVIERGPEFRVLATNSLDESFAASPAIVDKEIYLRGHQHLYCISSD